MNSGLLIAFIRLPFSAFVDFVLIPDSNSFGGHYEVSREVLLGERPMQRSSLSGAH